MTLRRLVIFSGLAAGSTGARCLLRRQFQFVVVRGDSMAPALNHGDLVLGRRRFSRVSHEDVVVFSVVPGDYREDVLLGRLRRRVKRVVAVAGDPAPPFLPAWLREHYDGTVPDRHLALAGDASHSEGSAQFGYIGVDRIESVVVRRLRNANSARRADSRVAHAGASTPPA